MSFYADRIMPRLIAAGMQNKAMTRYRPRIPPLATGRVLEVGIGSGLNLPYYGREVTRVFGLEPSEFLRQQAAEAARSVAFPVELLAAGAESIPLDSGSVDTVVSTWTLCSIPDLDAALGEIRRVLRPDGRLLFFEHGRAPDPCGQPLAGPARARCSGGWRAAIQTGRSMPASPLRASGWPISSASYLDGPRFISWHFVGQAVTA